MWSIPCFPVSVENLPDEAPLGRLVRHCVANELEDSWGFFCNAGFRDHTSWTDPALIEQINEYLGADQPPFLEFRPGNHDYAEIRLGEAWVDRSLTDLCGPVVCTYCLAEQPYRRALWDLVPFQCCPRHGVWLADRCPACGGALDLRHCGIVRCRCGFDLCGAADAPASSAVVEFHAWMARAAFPEGAWPIPERAVASSPLAGLSMRDLLKLGLSLGGHSSRRSLFEAPAGKSGEKLRRALENAAELVFDWPNRFEAALRGSQGQPMAGLSVLWRNSAIWRAVHDDLAEPQFEFLRDAFRTVRRTLWLDYRRRHQQPADHFAASDDLIGLSDAAFLLGLHRREVRQLVEAGLLRPVADPRKAESPNWLFDRSAVIRILGAFSDRLQPAPEAGYVIAMPFDRARDAANACGSSLTGLISAVFDGEISVVEEDVGKAGLYRFDLSLPDLLEVLLGARDPESAIGWKNAPAILGVPMGVCMWLYDRGILLKSGSWPNEVVRVKHLLGIARDVIVVRRVVSGSRTSLRGGRLDPGRVEFELLASRANGCSVVLCQRPVLEAALGVSASSR